MKTAWILVVSIASVLGSAACTNQQTSRPIESGFTRVEKSFESGKFTIDLPTGYDESFAQSDGKGTQGFAFSTRPRADGTRAMVQVTILDLERMAGEQNNGSLRAAHSETILTSMLAGVKGRRSEWKQDDTTHATISGVDVARVQWSGLTAAIDRSIRMEGIMYAGRIGSFAFVLHTQDVEPYVKEHLTLSDHSLQTFILRTTE